MSVKQTESELACVQLHPQIGEIQKLLPTDVAVVASRLDWFQCDEPKRQKEFRAGRSCAHAAIQRFGRTAVVAQADDRSPIWPTGFVGSISHDDYNVWAAVTTNWQYQSLGIDCEQVVEQATLDQLRKEVFTDAEWELLQAIQRSDAVRFTIGFSAKESFYKCWYPLTQAFFEFKQAAISNVSKGTLSVAMTVSNPNHTCEPSELQVNYLVEEQSVFTAVAMNLGEGAY